MTLQSRSLQSQVNKCVVVKGLCLCDIYYCDKILTTGGGAAAYFKYPPFNNQIMVNKRGYLHCCFLLVVDKCTNRRRTGERERGRK